MPPAYVYRTPREQRAFVQRLFGLDPATHGCLANGLTAPAHVCAQRSVRTMVLYDVFLHGVYTLIHSERWISPAAQSALELAAFLRLIVPQLRCGFHERSTSCFLSDPAAVESVVKIAVDACHSNHSIGVLEPTVPSPQSRQLLDRQTPESSTCRRPRKRACHGIEPALDKQEVLPSITLTPSGGNLASVSALQFAGPLQRQYARTDRAAEAAAHSSPIPTSAALKPACPLSPAAVKLASCTQVPALAAGGRPTLDATTTSACHSQQYSAIPFSSAESREAASATPFLPQVAGEMANFSTPPSQNSTSIAVDPGFHDATLRTSTYWPFDPIAGEPAAWTTPGLPMDPYEFPLPSISFTHRSERCLHELGTQSSTPSSGVQTPCTPRLLTSMAHRTANPLPPKLPAVTSIRHSRHFDSCGSMGRESSVSLNSIEHVGTTSLEPLFPALQTTDWDDVCDFTPSRRVRS